MTQYFPNIEQYNNIYRQRELTGCKQAVSGHMDRKTCIHGNPYQPNQNDSTNTGNLESTNERGKNSKIIKLNKKVNKLKKKGKT